MSIPPEPAAAPILEHRPAPEQPTRAAVTRLADPHHPMASPLRGYGFAASPGWQVEHGRVAPREEPVGETEPDTQPKHRRSLSRMPWPAAPAR